MSFPRLVVQSVSKAFGGVRAVEQVSFTVSAGELVALIGANGAGKTTCFNIVNGQLAPDSGTVWLGDRKITGLPPRAIARLGVGRGFQIAATFASMRVADNIAVARMGLPDGPSVTALLERVALAGQAGRLAAELAYADLKRLEIALALAGQPRLLLMDEPLAGMAAAERAQLMALLRSLVAEEQLAVLFTEHDIPAVFTHADRVLVMNRGALIADGRPAEVRENPEVRAAYLPPDMAAPSAATGASPRGVTQPPLLDVTGLSAFHGRAQALFDLDFQVGPGEVLALIGNNGAGKTTTLRALMGLLPGCRGRVCLEGVELLGRSPAAIARLGVGYVPEERRIFANLTVAENLAAGRQPPRPGVPHWTPERVFALFPNLAEMGRRPAGRMSGGEQQMLAVARTLMGNPRLLLLDEPSEGLAPRIVAAMADTVRQLKAEGVSIVLSEQNPHFAEHVADRAVRLEKGAVV